MKTRPPPVASVPGIVRVAQVHALLDLAGERIDGGEVALPAVLGLAQAAVPAALRVVLLAVDGDVDAGGHRRDVESLVCGL